MAKLGLFWHLKTGGCFLHMQLEKDQREMECLFQLVFEASKRGNDKVTSSQKINKRLLKMILEFLEATSVNLVSHSVPSLYPPLSELPNPDALSLSCTNPFSCCFPFPGKGRHKIRSTHSSLEGETYYRKRWTVFCAYVHILDPSRT